MKFKYCKHGNFHVKVIWAVFFLQYCLLLENLPHAKNKAHMNLLRKYDKYRENYPHVKGLCNIFAKFSPSENNHVYSTYEM